MNRVVVLAGVGFFIAAAAGACGGSTSSDAANAQDSGVSSDDGATGATSDGSSSEASSSSDAGNADIGTCVSSFGNAMDNNYGRLDGTLHAIVRPQDQKCAMPNGTHVDLEMDFGGATYRLLIDVQSDTGTDTRVLYLTKNAPLPGDPWSEGWHTSNVSLDYPTTFGVHSGDFTPYALADLTNIIVGELTIGEKLSIYAMGFGTGGHDIHRNVARNEDGAVVIGPDTANPKMLLFHFQDDATF
jgi:hypothetical protein